MNTREQLIALLEKLDGDEDNIGDVELLDKLIAERPYEPGETILVRPPGNTMEMVPAIFISVSPDDNTIVLANRLGGDSPQYFHDHRPTPKTRRLKPVPEEVMNDARSDNRELQRQACMWLANPENWEADDE